MASVAFLVGGAIVNALAFSGSNFLFSKLHSSGIEEERKRHDKAVEQLQAAQAEWSRRRTERLDYINEELRRAGLAEQHFQETDEALEEYYRATGRKLDPIGREPELSDYYAPSQAQKDREMAFIALGMAATSVIAFRLV